MVAVSSSLHRRASLLLPQFHRPPPMFLSSSLSFLLPFSGLLPSSSLFLFPSTLVPLAQATPPFISPCPTILHKTWACGYRGMAQACKEGKEFTELKAHTGFPCNKRKERITGCTMTSWHYVPSSTPHNHGSRCTKITHNTEKQENHKRDRREQTQIHHDCLMNVFTITSNQSPIHLEYTYTGINIPKSNLTVF